MNRDAICKEIIASLKKKTGQKARAIARNLDVDKKTVNSILYSNQYNRYFKRDFLYRWYLTPEAKEDEPKEEPEQETPGGHTSPINPYCKKCMIYKQEDCIGEKDICEFFKPSPDIPQEEIDNWPDEMGGPWGTLHNKTKKNKDNK